MEKPAGKGLSTAYAVLAVGDVVGVALSFFPVLAGLEIAGGIGPVAGIFRPKLGLAAAMGLVVYFVGAMIGHIRVGDFAGLSAPIVPFVLSVATLTLRARSMPRA